MIVYRLTDQIPIEMGEIKFWVSPLSHDHKVKLSTATKMQGGTEVMDYARVAFLTVKFSVKSVEGLKEADGSDYRPSFDPDGSLSDETVSELFQLDDRDSLVLACGKLAQKMTEHEIPGVTINLKGVRRAPKKKD